MQFTASNRIVTQKIIKLKKSRLSGRQKNDDNNHTTGHIPVNDIYLGGGNLFNHEIKPFFILKSYFSCLFGPFDMVGSSASGIT